MRILRATFCRSGGSYGLSDVDADYTRGPFFGLSRADLRSSLLRIATGDHLRSGRRAESGLHRLQKEGAASGRSAGQQNSSGSCSSGCRSRPKRTDWAKPTSSSEGLIFGGQVCLPSARATHAARHTCSDTYPPHAIQRAAHLRPTFHLTEHASVRVSRLSLECAERRRCTTFSSPTCDGSTSRSCRWP